MWILTVAILVTIQGVSVEQVFGHTSRFPTEQACYDQAKADAPMFVEAITKHYGEDAAKTLQITPKCENEGKPA